jgi:hypothetical protein
VRGMCWGVVLACIITFWAKTIEADGVEHDVGKGADFLMYWCKPVRSTVDLCQDGPSLSMS